MAKQLYALLNSHGKIDCCENETYKGKRKSLPRLFSSLQSAQYSASKYCEQIGKNIVYGCCDIVKVELGIIGKRAKKVIT